MKTGIIHMSRAGGKKHSSLLSASKACDKLKIKCLSVTVLKTPHIMTDVRVDCSELRQAIFHYGHQVVPDRQYLNLTCPNASFENYYKPSTVENMISSNCDKVIIILILILQG